MSEAEFNQAAEEVKQLPAKPSTNDLLELYALFKQATIGDCNMACPGVFDLKGKAKWQTWNSKKGLSQEDARKQYIAKVAALKG
ncbi:acyl-CoA-binding domain-containing protein 7-like [Varroa jacobsoni]|uniref:ACB domain-containing protein n=1 Tax=Varroa destructor TaxID=109461 RepID=A0A7M7MER6_VARDE|nr:acyl-CoA-binding domain-containing protein 7-like [Varroa destructor]XP_022701965.1 acyl-CoA-binding domain-containing protein 7-like [Varroa jacobsoni]